MNRAKSKCGVNFFDLASGLGANGVLVKSQHDWEGLEMNGAVAVRRDPLGTGEPQADDFGRLALDLLMELDAVHPSTVNLTNQNGSQRNEGVLKQICFYLRHQGIIIGELPSCRLTSTGRQSLHDALSPHQRASDTDNSASTHAAACPSTVLLGVMRHHFATQAKTN